MKKSGRSKTSKRDKAKPGSLTIGLAGFAKISAMEGLHLTRDMRVTFRDLERKGASARERRAAIVKKYGTGS
jgi:hypothetical protein